MKSRVIYKNQLGGIAESVDASLNKLGPWGKLGVQVLDPTGVTGWKDLGDALKAFQKEGGLRKAGELSLAALGAVPMLGMFKGFSKLLGVSKKMDKVGDASKLIKKVEDLPKSIDLTTYKKLLDPNFDIKGVLQELSTQELTKLKQCVEYSASQYLQAAGKNITSPELVAKTQRYEDLLSDIDKNIKAKHEKALDDLIREPEEILITPDHNFDVDSLGELQWEVSGRNLNRKAERQAADKALQRRRDHIDKNPVIYFT